MGQLRLLFRLFVAIMTNKFWKQRDDVLPGIWTTNHRYQNKRQTGWRLSFINAKMTGKLLENQLTIPTQCMFNHLFQQHQPNLSSQDLVTFLIIYLQEKYTPTKFSTSYSDLNNEKIYLRWKFVTTRLASAWGSPRRCHVF